MNTGLQIVEPSPLDPSSAAFDPAPMTPAAPHTSPVSFWRRAAAYSVDVLVCAVAVQFVQGALYFTWGDPREHLDSGMQWFVYMWLTVSAPVYAYFTLCESSASGATLGKRALGLVVRDVYGARIGVGRALWRTIGKLLPWNLAHLVMCFPAPPWDGGPDFELRRGIFAVYALVGANLATALMTRKQQSLHDLAVGTLVVRAPAAAGAA